jgi:hypothetical protein
MLTKLLVPAINQGAITPVVIYFSFVPLVEKSDITEAYGILENQGIIPYVASYQR